MLKRYKKKAQGGSQFCAPLTLEVANGVLQRTFGIDVIENVRLMTTELACNGGLPRRLVVASALQGEGATFTTLALATTLASDTAEQFCVVDLNWWSPGMFNQLDTASHPQPVRRGHDATTASPRSEAVKSLASSPGIAQVMAGKATLDEVIIHTSLPNLFLLPAGDLALDERPIIARSVGLRTLVDQLSHRFDYLLLDVPAILSTSDAIALASLGEACCLVIRQGVTPRSTVQRAIEQIKHLKMLGIVLNRVRIETPSWLRVLIQQD